MHFNFLDAALCLRVAETLLHFLWQGFAIGLAIWVINAFVAQGNSNLRYRINLLALLLMAACLPLTFAVLPARESASHRAAESVPAMTKSETGPVESTGPVELPAASPPGVTPQPSELIAEADVNESETPVVTSDAEVSQVAGPVAIPWMSRVAPYATAIYALGVMVMLLRLLLAVWGGQRLRRASQVIDEPGILAKVEHLARRLGLKVAPLAATCSRISGPVVVGILRPMILLPPTLVSSMSPAQLEAILAHEIAHLRRFDLFVNLLQRLIEAMLFFHPAVWYVSRRVSLERENSCDDLVMEHGCDRLAYADALLRMAEICTGHSAHASLETSTALAATGKHPSEFKSRVLRVVGESNGPPLRLTRWGLALLAAMLISLTALPWILGSHKFGTEALKGTTYSNQDGEFVYALHTDQEIVYALIVNYPEGQDFTWNGGGKSKSIVKGDVLEYLEAKWGTVSFRTEFESDDPQVVRFFRFNESEEIQPGDLRGYTPFSLQDGRIFYCDPSTHTFEQRTTLKDALPERPPVPSAKLADAIEHVVHLIETEFPPDSPALDLSGPLTDARFIDTVAAEVSRLHFATSWQSENARQFARQIARQHLSPDMPAEERRRTLASLHDHVTSFLHRHRDESNDDAYLRRPHDVRNLLWRLKLALVREPLDEASAKILESQLTEVRKWIQTVPPHRFSHLTSEAVVARLEQRLADPLEPIFKYPLPDQEFDRMMRELREMESTLNFAEFHAVAKWFNADVRSSPDLVDLTGSPDLKFISHGTSDADVHVGYPSTKVWSGHGTMIQEWSDIIDLSGDAPGVMGFDREQSVSQAKAGDDQFRKWAEEQSQQYGQRGHIAFDYQKRRLVGIQGTRFVKLDVDSFVAADQLNGDLLKDRIRQRGRGEFVFPEPKSVVNQPAHHKLIYDLYLGALTEDERLYVLKIKKIETDFKNLWYHARLHNPPRPNEVGETVGGTATLPENNQPEEETPAPKPINIKLKRIKAGSFLMGSPADDEDAEDDEKPQHRVRISGDFYIGATEVTQQQWEAVMGTTPWKGKQYVKEGPDYPATHVTWNDAVAFCERLSTMEGVTYRLPTEAEWEYACRAGSTTKYSFGDDAAKLADYAWFGFLREGLEQDEPYAHEVGTKRPNPWGLYDMHGNVSEYCSDWYEMYPEGGASEPASVLAATGSLRVMRGGHWMRTPKWCRSAERDPIGMSSTSNLWGFRVVRVPADETGETANAGIQSYGSAPPSVDATTLELYNRYISRVGKIETATVNAAIELVAARGRSDPEFRELLRKDFATSRQEDNQRYDSRKLLALITKVLQREGGMRWQHEFEQRTGNAAQRALHASDVLYRESPLLAEAIKHGRACDRQEIVDFAFAVRQAHHPQAKQFLMDVLNHTPDSSSPSGKSDKSKENWPDGIGWDWQEARFLAAVGLAELGAEEGVLWLIEHINEGGVRHHPHINTDSRGPSTDEALKDLFKFYDDRDKQHINWDELWNKNKKTFVPGRVYLKDAGY